MRLIDADVLYKTFMDGESDTEEERILNQLARYLIRHASSVDVVPVVRCRKCVHARESVHPNTVVCVEHDKTMQEDDFCSYGEIR